MDWGTRKVLSLRVPTTMHADFRVDALEEAVGKCDPPEIMSTKQGSRFTGSDWITTLVEAKVRGGMDKVFVERLWLFLKNPAAYLQEITDGFTAPPIIDDRMHFDNRERPHSALGEATPDEHKEGKLI
jgi:putative transposase